MNQLYPNARQKFLNGEIDWGGDAVAIALYDAGGVYNATHTMLSEVGGTQIDAGGELIGRLSTDGYASSDDYTYTQLSDPNTVLYAILYRILDQILIAHMDSVDGIPFKPSGGDYIIKGNGPDGAFFRL